MINALMMDEQKRLDIHYFLHNLFYVLLHAVPSSRLYLLSRFSFFLITVSIMDLLGCLVALALPLRRCHHRIPSIHSLAALAVGRPRFCVHRRPAMRSLSCFLHLLLAARLLAD